MKKVCRSLPPKDVLLFMDDAALPSKTIIEGLGKLRRFLEAVRESGMTLKLKKCVFLAKCIQYLGHVIEEGVIRPGQKLAAVNDFPVPADVHQVRQFLGLTGYFRKFIQNYANIVHPISDLLKKDLPFIWTDDKQKAFECIKAHLGSKPVLALYDVNGHHEVHTDAASTGLAAILLQSTERDPAL